MADAKGMTVNSSGGTNELWKNKLIGNSADGEKPQKEEEDFELMKGDATNEVIDGIPSITFFERVHQYIAQRMSRTAIVKLLGRRISYLTMPSKLQAIWKTKHPLQILDLETDYFSVKFHENEDYLADLSRGLWIIFVQYLMMYSKSLLKFIRNAIRPVTKIDHNTNVKSMGWFARLVIFVDLGKPLISKVKIDERIQRVEYESFPIVCFDYGRYGHYREVCPHKAGQEVDSMKRRSMCNDLKVSDVRNDDFETSFFVDR
ncbi:hypothetical protein Gogos_009320, partial [Gossypium gossypioides]|nr:hypothetical protein [Gossypium gossypioides]